MKLKPADTVTILGFDPSTEITGACLVRFRVHGDPELLDYIAIDARASCKGDGLINRLARVRWTREQLYDWLSRLESSVEIVAYETDTNRGHASSEALKMAAGAYLCLPHLSMKPLEAVTRQKACIAAGCLREYRAPKGRTRADQDAKTLMLKTAVRVAMDRFFPDACLTSPATAEEKDRLKAEAIADSLAIALASGNDWIEAQRLLALPKQTKMRAAPKKKEAASA